MNNNNSLLDALNIKQTTKTTKVNTNNSIENQINTRLKEVAHETLLKEFPQYYKKIENSTFLNVDKNNELSKKKEPTFNYEGFCVLIPQSNTTIKNGKHIHKIDEGFRVGFLQTYLKGAKSTICEYVTINNKKVTTFKKK
tara:strand:+ start:531 stop:950 length:420 start_codon:yes stop_codon:yes gene_type:complete